MTAIKKNSMSSSSPHRAQTEPIAALVAVATIALALGLYAGFVTDSLPGTSDRAVEEPTLERVWAEIQDDGQYNDSATTTLDRRSLPENHHVYISITVFGDGEETTLEQLYFDADSEEVPLTTETKAEVPPPETRVATRPIPIRIGPGDVRGGTLRVEVW